ARTREHRGPHPGGAPLLQRERPRPEQPRRGGAVERGRGPRQLREGGVLRDRGRCEGGPARPGVSASADSIGSPAEGREYPAVAQGPPWWHELVPPLIAVVGGAVLTGIASIP